MAVSESDVQHVAALARLAIPPDRLPSLVQELNGILEHMDVLNSVDTGDGGRATGDTPPATPLRSDETGSSITLTISREQFAPLTRDGFFLVPRLATHEDQGEQTS